MCAMDRRERALISQLHFPHSLGEAISFLKYPVCVRFEDGSFIQEITALKNLSDRHLIHVMNGLIV